MWPLTTRVDLEMTFAWRLASWGLLLTMLSCPLAAAQVIAPGLDQAPQNTYPNDQYYVALELYREGDLANAAEAFDASLGRCRRDVDGRWIDAIPVHAMLGECFYQAGDLSAAVEHFDQALALVIRNRGWLGSLEWKDATIAAVRTPDLAASWAAPNIPAILPLNDRMKLGTGSADIEGQLRRGGTFESFRLTTIDAVEVMRGAAIASYRRRIIFGPLSNQSTVADEALEATKYPAGLELPIPRALIGAMRGCERFAGYQDDEALVDANRSAVVGGAVHPLTPIVLLATARLLAERDKFEEAVPIAIRAAAAASTLRQPEWVGEAFLIAAGCADSKSAPLMLNAATGAASAHIRRGRVASIGALLAAVEGALLINDTAAANTALAQVGTMLQNRNIAQPRLAAHGEYLTAVAAAQTGGSLGITEPSAIDAALSRMYTFTSGNGPKFRRSPSNQQRGSTTAATPRLYQLGLVALSARSRGVGGKVVDEKLDLYAADPSASVWRADPVDAIAYQVFDRSQAIAAQMESALKQNKVNDLLVLGDALSRQRFLATQPLGGRVLQARRLAATDKTLLTEKAAAAIAKPAPALSQMVEILASPVPLPGTPELLQRGQRLEALATLLALQRRELAAAAPPAIAGVSDLERLPKDQALLMFVDLGGRTIAVLASQKNVTTWPIASSKAIGVDIAKLMREIGASSNRAASRLEGEANWKKQAATLRRKLIPDEHLTYIESLSGLVVIPDGMLWYLPFELLPMGDENTDLLGERLAIRYSTTPGLALHPVAFPNFERPTGLVSQLFFAPRDGEANAQAVKTIQDALKASTTLPSDPAVVSSMLGESIGPLAVFGIVTPNLAQPFSLAPALYDAAEPLGSLNAWMRFPSRVPPSLFLPGYRTAATSPSLGDGRELFLTLTAMHCAGVRDIVISRWAVGGESTAILAQEFLQELPFEGFQPAWQRAVQALRKAPLRPAGEPLLGTKDQSREELTGDHPLFWAGYMIDAPLVQDAK